MDNTNIMTEEVESPIKQTYTMDGNEMYPKVVMDSIIDISDTSIMGIDVVISQLEGKEVNGLSGISVEDASGNGISFNSEEGTNIKGNVSMGDSESAETDEISINGDMIVSGGVVVKTKGEEGESLSLTSENNINLNLKKNMVVSTNSNIDFLTRNFQASADNIATIGAINSVEIATENSNIQMDGSNGNISINGGFMGIKTSSIDVSTNGLNIKSDASTVKVDASTVIVNSNNFKVDASSVSGIVNGASDVYLGCPIGTIVMWGGEIDSSNTVIAYTDAQDASHYVISPCEGWLLCNGSMFYDSNSDAKNYIIPLYRVIGNSFDPNTAKMNGYLPNFKGCFPYGSQTLVPGNTGGSQTITSNVSINNILIPNNEGDVTEASVCVVPKGTHFAESSTGNYNGEGLYANIDRHGGTLDSSSRTTTLTGSAISEKNLPPYLDVHFIIKYK